MNPDDIKKRQGQGQEKKPGGGRPATKFIEREKIHPENRPEEEGAAGGEASYGETSFEDPSKEKKLPDPNWKEGPYTKRDKDKEPEEGSEQ
jgi:hypothetical protein